MTAPERTSGVLVLLALMPAIGASGQTICALTATNGLRPFGPGSEIRFEPSAVVFLPEDCSLLVFSDKSERLEAFRFSIESGRLGAGEMLQISTSPGVVQLEAVTRTADGSGVLVVTSGTFKGAAAVDQSREDRAFVIAPDGTGGWEVAEDLTAPWRRYMERLRRASGGWLKVEALHVLDDRYLVGVRQFGASFDRFDFGVRVAVWDPTEPSVTSILADPRALTFEERGDMAGRDRTYMRTYGISSLECVDQPGSSRLRCYMLASSEAGWGMSDLKTRLMAFDLEELAESTSLPGYEVACFWGKAEGLTLVGEETAFVVFDSDGRRKGGSAGRTNLYQLDDHQDFYWVGSVRRPMAGDGGVDDGNGEECVGP